ncbi:MAG: efflux RND transporter periplasmic adaptor subunit [Gemmatimonadaceae bacterium]|nr:efflux RND transporter periplasmic adaptor subunit [Gemmatimonadaceae bacterium]MCC6431944.1 efflux RND transporter periplasmic adaptor subunit [Gemmatimonadaceae bacterium]
MMTFFILPRAPRVTRRLTARLLASTAMAGALAACGGDAEANGLPAVPASAVTVTVSAIESGPMHEPVRATGTFTSRDEIPLAFKIGGVIADVRVDQGATVRKGQVLASLDLREIDALVNKARVGVEKAERDAARLARLQRDSVATLAQLQDATSALDAARADLATARVNREFAMIVAPEQGTVLERRATPGTTIGAGAPVLIMGGGVRGRVMRAGLSDRDALRTRVGDSAVVRFDAVPGETFRGTVTLLGKAADARTGTYTVEVQLRQADALPNGLVGRIEIAVRSRGTAAMIPVDALLEADADSATVYTVSETEPFTARAHRVRVSQLVGDRAAVTGLDQKDRVITRGAPYVTPGAIVRIAPATVSASGDTARGGPVP